MERYEIIVVLDNEIEASLMEEILTEREIPHILKSYRDSAYDGLFQVQKGWGHVLAPVEFKEEILAIHKDLSKGVGDSDNQ